MSGQSKWQAEDDDLLPDQPFIRKVAEDLWEGSLTLILWGVGLWILGLTLLYVMALFTPLGIALATLSLAPALAGLMVTTGKAAKGGFLRLSYAAQGVLHLYWRSVALAAPLAIWLVAFLITSSMMGLHPDDLIVSISWGTQVGLGITMAAFHIYLLPVLALRDTSLIETLRLAAALIVTFIWQTMGLAAAGIVLLALTTLHPLVWLFVPGLWCVIVMNATWRMSKHMVIVDKEDGKQDG
ncbi:MAG: hypothetical protein JW850_06505 [Thermoflexales bacterium]|nr:hypothetical protein [Thermoflexales bacterium]